MVGLWLEWKLLALMGNASSLRKEEKLSQISTNHLYLQTAARRLGERAQELAAHYHLDVGLALEACPCCHLWACVSD